MLACARGTPAFSASLRTQTRPAIEFVSGEEGLRPKTYFLVYSFIVHVFNGLPEVRRGPWPHWVSRGEMGYVVVAPVCRSAAVQYIRCCPFSILFNAPGGGLPGMTLFLSGRPPLSPCAVRRVQLVIFKGSSKPHQILEGGSIPVGPRGRLVPVRRSRHRCLALAWTQAPTRDPGTDPKNGPLLQVSPRRYLFNLDMVGDVYESAVVRRNLPNSLAEVSFLT